MDGVGISIIGRPRPLPGHDTPNPAYHPHTLNYEEPVTTANATIEIATTTAAVQNCAMKYALDGTGDRR